MWAQKIILKHNDPYQKTSSLNRFAGSCIDQNDIGHELLDAVLKKTVCDRNGVLLGQIQDVQLLAKNLTPQYLEIVSWRWALKPTQHLFYPFSLIEGVSDEKVYVRPAGGAETSQAEELLSLKQKLQDEENRLGWHWEKEYEDQKLYNDPFCDEILW